MVSLLLLTFSAASRLSFWPATFHVLPPEMLPPNSGRLVTFFTSKSVLNGFSFLMAALNSLGCMFSQWLPMRNPPRQNFILPGIMFSTGWVSSSFSMFCASAFRIPETVININAERRAGMVFISHRLLFTSANIWKFQIIQKFRGGNRRFPSENFPSFRKRHTFALLLTELLNIIVKI